MDGAVAMVEGLGEGDGASRTTVFNRYGAYGDTYI
jgi:hypothetical protein